MTLSVKSISRSDGRLSSKRPVTEAFKVSSASSSSSASRDGQHGLFMSNSKTSRIRKNNQLLSNANDAISLIQVADGALDATTTALHEMRSLSTQTTDHTNTIHNQLDVLSEKLQLTEKIWAIFRNTKFNNQPLLNGSVKNQNYPVGDSPDQVIPVTIGNLSTVVANLKAQVNLKTISGNQTKIIDNAIDSVTDVRASLDSLRGRFENAIAQLNHASNSTSKATNHHQDETFVKDSVTFARDIILKKKDISLIAQANQQPNVVMKLLEEK